MADSVIQELTEFLSHVQSRGRQKKNRSWPLPSVAPNSEANDLGYCNRTKTIYAKQLDWIFPYTVGEKCGLEDRVLGNSHLSGWTNILSGLTHTQMSAYTEVSVGSIAIPGLANIFINELDKKRDSIIDQICVIMKLGMMANTLNNRIGILKACRALQPASTVSGVGYPDEGRCVCHAQSCTDHCCHSPSRQHIHRGIWR